MDETSIAFLERWVEENVKPVAAGKHQAEATRLAAACIQDAAEDEIAESDLEEIAAEETDGDDLIAYMSKAIENASAEDTDNDGDEEDEDA